MNILIACEFSGRVRDAFIYKGHNAWSCDLLPTERPGPHIEEPVEGLLDMGWDMMIAFPPCTYLASSGLHWNKRIEGRAAKTEEALAFVQLLLNAPIPKIALENPIGCISTCIRKPDQIIQPWMFGHEATKATCLWLKELPPLVPTKVVGKGEFVTYASGKRSTLWHAKTGGGSGKKRSVTFEGIAKAMAEQWG